MISIDDRQFSTYHQNTAHRKSRYTSRLDFRAIFKMLTKRVTVDHVVVKQFSISNGHFFLPFSPGRLNQQQLKSTGSISEVIAYLAGTYECCNMAASEGPEVSTLSLCRQSSLCVPDLYLVIPSSPIPPISRNGRRITIGHTHVSKDGSYKHPMQTVWSIPIVCLLTLLRFLPLQSHHSARGKKKIGQIQESLPTEFPPSLSQNRDWKRRIQFNSFLLIILARR